MQWCYQQSKEKRQTEKLNTPEIEYLRTIAGIREWNRERN